MGGRKEKGPNSQREQNVLVFKMRRIQLWHLSLMPLNSTLELLNRWSVCSLQRTCSFQNSSLSRGKPYPGSFVTKAFLQLSQHPMVSHTGKATTLASSQAALCAHEIEFCERGGHHRSCGLGAWVRLPEDWRKTVNGDVSVTQ